MTPLSSTGQNTVRTYFIISTTKIHTYSSQWNQHNKAHYHSWTPSVTTEPDTTFSTTVYRKPTCTDQYLHWDSNHHITAKQSVYNTLVQRAKIVSSKQDKMDRELQHIRTALQHCQFPDWALNQWQHKFTNPIQPTTHHHQNNNNNPPDNDKKNITIVVPYMPNTGEKFRKLCKKKGIQVHFKGTNTLRTALGNPKDKDPKHNQTGIIYHYQCPQTNCPNAYIGESGMIIGRKSKGTFQGPFPLSTFTAPPHDTLWIQNNST